MALFIRSVAAAVLLAGGVLCATRAGSAGEDKVKLAPLEAKLLALTNQARQEKKLKPYRVNAVLTKVARAHAQNMAKQGKLEHILDGKKPEQRIKDAGYVDLGYGENIYFHREGGGAAETAFRSWMGSPPHRANILDKEFIEIGIGQARDTKGFIYFTQVFAVPAK